jgi:hypothetical protein
MFNEPLPGERQAAKLRTQTVRRRGAHVSVNGMIRNAERR